MESISIDDMRRRDMTQMAVKLCAASGYVSVTQAAAVCPELATCDFDPPIKRATPQLIVDTSHPACVDM